MQKLVHIDTYYKIDIDGTIFQLLHTKVGDKEFFQIIDSKGKDCVKLSIENGDPERELFLPDLSYRSNCSVKGSFERGIGTLRMIKASLIFSMKLLPDMDSVVFSDDSTFDCELPGEKTRINIPLHTFSFVLYGQTWYSRKLGAVLEDNRNLQESLDRSRSLLQDTVSGEFRTLWNTKTSSIDEPWLAKQKVWIQKCFEERKGTKSSWMELFQTVFAKKDSDNCATFYLLMPNILSMFQIPNIQMSQWKIERATIEAYPEYKCELQTNYSPIHIKKSKQKNVSYLFQNIPYFLVGGGGTRKHTRNEVIRYIPRFYGGIKGYLIHSRKERLGSLKRKYTQKVNMT